jgi:pimeloyl-ACP methyl ester carboxylesterase
LLKPVRSEKGHTTTQEKETKPSAPPQAALMQIVDGPFVARMVAAVCCSVTAHFDKFEVRVFPIRVSGLARACIRRRLRSAPAARVKRTVAKHFPERLLSLVVGGSTAYGASNKAEPGPLLKIFRQGVQEGIETVVEGMRALAGSITPHYEERLRGLDLQAMVAVMEYHNYQRPGLENDVLQIELPCLFYAGDADEGPHKYGKEIAQQMPNVCFYSLPGLNHVGASDATEQIVPHVLSFLAGVEEKRQTCEVK